MSSVGSVSVLICSRGPVCLFGRSPQPLRAATTVRPGQPSLYHLAICPHWVLEGRKQSGHSTCKPTVTHITHTWSRRVAVALVYPALPPSLRLLSFSASSLSCCVSLPTNVSATVGQWLILVCLAKCLQDVCLGCLSHPLAHPVTPCTSWSRGSRVASTPPPSFMPPTHTRAHHDFLTGGEEGFIVFRKDKGYLNWQRSSFLIRATFYDPPPPSPLWLSV